MRGALGLVAIVMVLLIVGGLVKQNLSSTTQATRQLAQPPAGAAASGSAPNLGQATQQVGSQVERLTEQTSAQRNEESK